MKRLTKLSLAVIAVIASGFLATAGAQTLDMQGISPGDGSDRPSRGMSQDTVESRFGAPSSKSAAVGDPPISKWEYPGFVVYFEYDLVIHTVAKRGIRE